MSRGQLTWGVMLVLVGVLLLGVQLGIVPTLGLNIWTIILAAVALVFFVGFLATGKSGWGMLIPAGVLGGIAATIALGEAGAPGGLTGAAVLWGIGLPFLAAVVVLGKEGWWGLIPGGVLLGVGLTAFLSDFVAGGIAAGALFWTMALSWLLIYLLVREHWWALIPAGVLFVVGIFPMLGSVPLPDGAVGIIIMGLLGGAFLVVALVLREQWWAYIPAYILFAVAAVIGLASFTVLPDHMVGAAFLALLALGALLLWLFRARLDTGWAIYLAGGLLVVAAATAIGGENTAAVVWPLLLLAFGGWLLFRALSDRNGGEAPDSEVVE